MDRLRIQYPAPPDGKPFWGYNTAPYDFCEQNYVITAYIAEFINTLTNISYLIYAAYGIRRFSSSKRFWSKTASYWGIALVGITSALFHGCLLKWPQFSDDLSMLVATGIVFGKVLSHGKSEAESRRYALLIFVVLGAVSVYHCWMAEKVIHQIFFIGMVIIIARRTRQIIRARVSDQELRSRMIGMAHTGTYFSIAALILWLIDQKACGNLQAIRDVVGLPWGFLFEFHGWWHILTAISVYDYFVLVDILTGEGTIEQNIVEGSPFAWPVSSQLSKARKA